MGKRKGGLGPQGRRSIAEGRAGDGPSKGAFSELPGRIESGQTEVPADLVPGFAMPSEQPKRKRKGGIGPIGASMIAEARAANPEKTWSGVVMDAADRLAGMLPYDRVGQPATAPRGPQQRPDRPAPSDTPSPGYGGLLGTGLGANNPGGTLLGGNGDRFAGPANPSDTVDILPARPGEQWRGGPPTADRQEARKRDLEEMYQSGTAIRPPATGSNQPTLRRGTTTGTGPSPANAGPGRSAPTNGGPTNGGPVISGPTNPFGHLPPPPSGGGGFWNGLGGAMDAVAPYVPLATKAIKALFRPSPYAPLTWAERTMSPEGNKGLYGPNPTLGMYPYETNRYHIEPKRRDPSEHFYSSRHDPTIPDPQPNRSRSTVGYPEGDGIPQFHQGGNTTPAERLHRDPLHENTTGTLWGSTHNFIIGTIGGDAHTRTTRGFGDPTPSGRVEPIRAPQQP